MECADEKFLDGQLLIAMPGMGDPRFERAVIFMCAHSPEGAMGLIINKPAPELRFRTLLEQLKIKSEVDIEETPVHFGGPVEHGRGFVLHSSDYTVDGGSLRVNPSFAMTATLDIWSTEYLHVLEGEDPVLEWVTGTGLRPILNALSDADAGDPVTGGRRGICLLNRR